jgi:hypothetical protein
LSTQAMKDYMSCLKQNQLEAEKCRSISKRYLECRMEKYEIFYSLIIKALVGLW